MIPSAAATKPCLLIIDDVPANISTLADLLPAGQYEISGVSDSSQAVSMACQLLPDLILLDVVMPAPDGFAVCRALKQRPETAGIPVIFLTGRQDLDDLIKGFEAGGVDYITRPFSAPELFARIRTHVELKRAREFQAALIHDLQKALQEVQTLSGLLPICANCKKIRDDKGFWKQVESYISSRTGARFSHGICPDCLKNVYGELPPRPSPAT